MSAEDEEDDYMSMSFADTEPKAPLSSLQKKQLQRKQAEQRGPLKSKKELEAEAAAARNAALNTALEATNKGAKLLAKLGYKGGALGKSENARIQPIEVQMKDDRGGIGADNEKKRKIREHMESVQGKEKRQKADEGEYRERVAREREEKKNEGMMWGAMRIAEKFDTEAEEDGNAEGKGQANLSSTGIPPEPTKSDDSTERPAKPNVLWRSLVRQRADRDKERKLRHAMTVGLSMRRDDTEEDADDRLALGTEIEEFDDEEDRELDEFNALEPAERLERIVKYLRDTYHYCFWCKFRYPDADMEGCPGTSEEEHD